MINYFKNTKNIDKATELYLDLCKSLIGNNDKRLNEASRQFADLYSKSYQNILLGLVKIKNLKFHTKGYWIIITGESFQHRFKISKIMTGSYKRVLSEEKGNWYFMPRDEYDHSFNLIITQIKNIPGLTYEVKNSTILLTGKTFEFLADIKSITTGKYRRQWEGSTKSWCFYPYRNA